MLKDAIKKMQVAPLKGFPYSEMNEDMRNAAIFALKNKSLIYCLDCEDCVIDVLVEDFKFDTNDNGVYSIKSGLKI